MEFHIQTSIIRTCVSNVPKQKKKKQIINSLMVQKQKKKTKKIKYFDLLREKKI